MRLQIIILLFHQILSLFIKHQLKTYQDNSQAGLIITLKNKPNAYMNQPTDPNTPNKLLEHQPNMLANNGFLANPQNVEFNNGPNPSLNQYLTFSQADKQNDLNRATDFPQRITETRPPICGCAGDQKCGCSATNEPMVQGVCECAPPPICPPCIISKTLRKMHQLASQNAIQDAETQKTLQEESNLEKKLFQKAKEFASQASEFEKKAKEKTIEVQKHASNAQIARNKMVRAENQAKQLALDALKTITVHPPHEATNVPGLKVEQIGMKTTSVTAKTPQYNLHIGKTNSEGFVDSSDAQMSKSIGVPVSKFARFEQIFIPNEDDERGDQYLE